MKSRHCAATNGSRVSKAATGIALAAGTLLMTGALTAHAQTSGNTTPAKTVPAAKSSAPTPVGVKAENSYSLGVSFGTQLHGLGVTSDSVAYERLIQGLKDALAGKVVAGPADGQRVQSLIEGARTSQGTSNKAAAAKFLAENGKLPGVITTASGLQYKVVRPGTGETPKATDEATVNYRGTLLDGTEFDNSYKRGQPASFPVSGVIKGWQEGLQLMKVGSKVELYVPPDLAYGMQSPPPIPPGSLLKFEVELLSVKPAAAAAAGSHPKQ